LSRELTAPPPSFSCDPTLVLHTSRGPVSIYAPCPPGCFKDLKLEAGLGNFAHYSSIIQKLDVFEKVASARDGRVALALLEDHAVTAYMTCGYPEPDERWSKLGDLMYELATIEVSRNFRHMHIAQTMIGKVLADAFFETKITYMNGFSWHWDLDGTGLTMSQYRQMMIRLLKEFEFQECYTNEPNIAMREENLFMVRVGSKVSEEDQKRFRNLRFGIVNRD
jgi:acetoin utilization protein AcuA